MSSETTPPNNADSTLDEVEKIAAAIKLLRKAGIQVAPAENSPRVGKLRPLGNSSTSNTPYYNEAQAQQIKIIFDRLISDPSIPGFFLAREKMTRALSTTYLCFNQGARFLCDHLDPDGTYRAFYDKIVIRKAEDGIRLEYKKQAVHNLVAVAATVDTNNLQDITAEKVALNFRKRIEKFLQESAPGDMLDITNGVNMSVDEAAELTEIVNGTQGFIGRITAESIKIRHIKAAQQTTQ